MTRRLGKSRGGMLVALRRVDAGQRVWYASADREGYLLPTAIQIRWHASAEQPALCTQQPGEVDSIIDEEPR